MSNKYPGGIITSGAAAGYSVFFDGTGDYLQSSTSTTLDLDGAINFTIEAWVYVTAWGSGGGWRKPRKANTIRKRRGYQSCWDKRNPVKYMVAHCCSKKRNYVHSLFKWNS